MTLPPVTESSVTNGTASVPDQSISADEIALYDRQIRLWGMKAQERIRNANILLITMKALANEIAKNLVLAGIGSLTIVDHEVVTEADLGAQFFLTASHVGTNRAVAASTAIQKLNPRVKVLVETSEIQTQSPSYFAQFDIVIATDIDNPPTLNLINTATRLNSRPFYAASSHGIYGFLFADLIEHDFVIERTKSNMPTVVGPESRTRSVTAVRTKPDNHLLEQVSKRELYSTWLLASDLASLPAEILKSPRRKKAVTPILSCLRALWGFVTRYGVAPQANNHDALAQFTRMCGDKHKALGLPTETLRSEVLRSFLQNIGSEIAPVAAVLGGQLAQDVINVLGGTQQPIQNFVIFDGGSMEATVYALHPEGPLGKELLSAGPPRFGDVSGGLDGTADLGMMSGGVVGGDVGNIMMTNGGVLDPNVQAALAAANPGFDMPAMAAGPATGFGASTTDAATGIPNLMTGAVQAPIPTVAANDGNIVMGDGANAGSDVQQQQSSAPLAGASGAGGAPATSTQGGN